MADKPVFYITTPIYYVNDVPHIGHAYTSLACDVLARFKRLDGYDVQFLTGTDEHGQKVEKSAAAAGMTPQAFCDQVSASFRKLAEAMNFSNTNFIRTTEPRHIEACQALWRKLEEKGEIYLDKYAGWYSVRDEAFYGEGELTAGPNGEKLAPTGAPVEWVEEESYFFRLSAWGDRLLDHYAQNPDAILPAGRRNEVLSFIKSGLRDLSVSRTSFSWGVPVPGNDKHIMYVWIDALTNYITELSYPTVNADFQKYWETVHHIVGKDILRFHAIYWPAFLMAADLTPPKRVFAHGWWTNEGQKISKSLGNVIDPFAIIDEYGLDPVRYFLMREVPFGQDGDFSKKAVVHRINGDLANDIGNLAQRSLSMIAKNCGAAVPTPGTFSAADQEILGAARNLLTSTRDLMDRQQIHVALEEIWKVIGAANSYFAAQEPWALKKTDPERMGTVLYVTAEVLRTVALLVQPIMPEASGKLLDQLGVTADTRDFAHIGDGSKLVPGTPLPAPQGIFPRILVDA